jgi:hypothetical protein
MRPGVVDVDDTERFRLERGRTLVEDRNERTAGRVPAVHLLRIVRVEQGFDIDESNLALIATTGHIERHLRPTHRNEPLSGLAATLKSTHLRAPLFAGLVVALRLPECVARVRADCAALIGDHVLFSSRIETNGSGLLTLPKFCSPASTTVKFGPSLRSSPNRRRGGATIPAAAAFLR